MTTTFKIEQLVRDAQTGLVTQVHWRATAQEDAYQATAYGSVGLEATETFVPFAELTEATVLDWTKAKLDVTAIEQSLLDQIAQQKAPKELTGLPWASAV